MTSSFSRPRWRTACFAAAHSAAALFLAVSTAQAQTPSAPIDSLALRNGLRVLVLHDAALKNGAEIYFSLYFGMTGLHATHMIFGGFVLVPLIVMAARGKFGPAWYTPIELFGLYWHFVDIVWIFLFPLLYLVERHQ